MNGHGIPPLLSSRTTTVVSCMNRFLSAITLLALGAIGGFAIFHSAFQYRIERSQYTHNETLEIVKSNYLESEKERKQCVETDDEMLREISDLRSRLDAQSKSWHDLTAAQRSMLSRDEENRERIRQFREGYEKDQKTLASLKAELERKDSDLNGVKEKLVAVQGDLQMQRQTNNKLESEVLRLQDAKSRESEALKGQLKQRDYRIESVEKSLRRLDEQREKLEEESQTLRRTIQERDQELEKTMKNVTEMKGKTGELESQIEQKDKVLFKYREEEGNLEKQLLNFRAGMLELMTAKISEIENLEERVASLKQEKVDLEAKLENWREGMLKLVKEKIEEIEGLKAMLAESQKSTENTMKEVELAREEQIEAEEFVRIRLDIIDQNIDAEKEDVMRELMMEVEHAREQLKESQDWVVTITKDIEIRKADQAKSEELIMDKTNEIMNLKLEIERNQASAEQTITTLQSNLAEAQKLVLEKTKEIERLNSELGEFVGQVNTLKSAIVPGITTSEMMIKHVQQRDGMICRQLFGKGPYYVKFVVKLPGQADGDYYKNAFFVVELSSRKELPHSTYTFLTLVESNLYNGDVAFLSAQDNGGLRITSRHSTGTISLEQKLKPLGLTDGSSLSFVETSTSDKPLPCGDFSLGFIHRGPGLNFFLPGRDEDHTTFDDKITGCFARVIRGQDSLQKIRSLLLEDGEPVEIVSVEHLRVD